MTKPARILLVAGSDSGGGAGIQADIKSVTALGGFATSAVTALTAQNTRGVQGVWPVDPPAIGQQMVSVLDDIGTDAVKTGMLHSREVIETVAARLEASVPHAPLVVDPVMVAQSGDRLIEEAAEATLRQRLVPLATVLTPNIPEAEVLAGRSLGSDEPPAELAGELLELGCNAVLLKGGHAAGEEVVDVLVARHREPLWLRYPRIETRHNHGTGCTLASGIAAGLGQSRPLEEAVERARAYLQRAIELAPGFGSGAGPVHHGHTVAAFEPGTPGT
jgi:hydroxymethylpyrimidine/phosphomethylpyrimidine kinase